MVLQQKAGISRQGQSIVMENPIPMENLIIMDNHILMENLILIEIPLFNDTSGQL